MVEYTKVGPPVRLVKRPGPPDRSVSNLTELVEVYGPEVEGRLSRPILGWKTLPCYGQTKSAMRERQIDRHFMPSLLGGLLQELGIKRFFELVVPGQMVRYFVEI